MIPWLPREVSFRLADRPHETENMKTTYLLSSAFVGGFLAREDGRRPSWFDRMHLPPKSLLTSDQQESLGKVGHIICTKMRREVNSDPTSAAGRPPTPWQAGLLFARVLWRALFVATAAKAGMAPTARPVLFMTACHTLKSAGSKLLTQIWLEIQEQFTSKCNKYRNIKSRPAWAVLEALQYQVFALGCNFGLRDPATTPGSNKGSKSTANLQDFLEEVLALRFMLDWLEACMKDSEEYLEHSLKRVNYRRPTKANGMDPVAFELAELKHKHEDSFEVMWAEDTETRGVAALAVRIVAQLEGPAAFNAAVTHTGLLLAHMWKGVQPILAHYASQCISRLVEAQSGVIVLPPPRLDEKDEDQSQTAVFHHIAGSYAEPTTDTLEIVSALPRGVRVAIVKVQATFRGYLFRSRYFSRAREVTNYCTQRKWPRLVPPTNAEEDDPKEARKRKQPKREEETSAEADTEEVLARPSSGPRTGASKAAKSEGKSPASPSPTGGPASPSRAQRSAELADRRAWPLPTADHRACADLFALYMYSMYRRRELTNMWSTCCGAYERGMGAFAELLTRNPALRPMLESIAAQLKRGSVVGFDKAFIAKQKKGDEAAQASKLRPLDADLFKRRDARQRPKDETALGGTQGTAALGGTQGAASLGGTLGAASLGGAARSSMSPSASAPTLAPPRSFLSKDDKKATKDLKLTEEYLMNYLKEMDGDDSQFKDISSAVIPLSTGMSPPRQSPPDAILGADSSRPSSSGGAGEDDGSGLQRATTSSALGPKKGKPKVTVPLCMERAKPIWLPIKAHRFAAYRAKVLQLLPQAVLQQYIEFEKEGQYAACIKLLESATPGSLNVLNPASLVNNKPLLVETVLQLIVGYSGLCLRNKQGSVAVRLITQVIDNMSLSLRDLHPGHRTVLEAYLFDTALSVCYYMPADVSLTDRAESFFLQASDRYVKLGHTNRYCKCCLRAAAVLHGQGNRSEAEYYTQQALNKLADAPMSSLLAVCYHNLAVHTVVQQRIPDSVAHVRAYVALLKQLPKLGNSWMQLMDNTQWLVLKVQELWPQYQLQTGMREPQHETISGVPNVSS